MPPWRRSASSASSRTSDRSWSTCIASSNCSRVSAVGNPARSPRSNSSRSQSSGYSPGQYVAMSRSTALLDRLERLLPQILTVEDLLAAQVDDLALLVHHLVVLEHVLADLEVAIFDGALRALDGLRDHLRLERHVVGEGTVHHPAHRTGREQPHQIVFERQVEAALARVTLAAGATTELVVDAPALVALRAEHIQPADLTDLLALGRALLLEAGEEGRRSAPDLLRE